MWRHTLLPSQQSQPQHTRFSSYPICFCLLSQPSNITHYTLHYKLHTTTHPSKFLHIHKMDATTQAQPLADRSTNTHLTSASDKTDLKGSDISSMEYHRQVLQGKVTSEE